MEDCQINFEKDSDSEDSGESFDKFMPEGYELVSEDDFSIQDIEEDSVDFEEQSDYDRLTPIISKRDIEAINIYFAVSQGTAEVSYKYKMCNDMDRCERSNKEHLKHKCVDLFYCAHCDYKTRYKKFLILHMSEHNNRTVVDKALNKYHCKSTNSGRSKKYRSTLAEKRMFQCNLHQHNIAHSSNLKQNMLNRTRRKKLMCNICAYKCNHPSQLRQHMLKHIGEKKYKCTLCDFKTVWPANVKQHMLNHTREKQYKCKFCNFKTSLRCNLKQHKVSHTLEKQYICNMCEQKFNHVSNLYKHMLTHTGEKKFFCDICDYKCIQLCNLKRHIVNNHRR